MNKTTERGPAPTAKARCRDEFDLVAFRHMEFRKVDNPDPERLKYYESTITSTSAAFYRKCKNLCADSMIEVEDLKSYARIWTCNYIGLYQLPDDSDSQNIKLLRAYLSQRFNELRKLLWKKGRNIFVHYDEAHIAMCGTPYSPENRICDYAPPDELGIGDNYYRTLPSEDPEVVDKEYVVKKRGYTSNSVEKRKALASKTLQENLDKLGHDRMVEILTEAGENLRIHPDAKKHAIEKLRVHTEECEKCKLAAPKEDEKVARV